MMESPACDAFGFTPTVNYPLRNCAFIDNLCDPPPRPLLSGDTVECNEDMSVALIEDLAGETKVLVDEGDKEHSQLTRLDCETQVMDHLDDGCETCIVAVDGETQVMNGYEGDTLVYDVVYHQETQPMVLGGETEVQDDEECVRNVCSQFMRNGLDCDFTGTESGTANSVIGNVQITLIDEKKLGYSHSKPLERGSTDFSATPPSTVEVDPGSFQRSFTSIRAASLRASGLAARFKALVEARNNLRHKLVEKENVISTAACTPGSEHDPGIAEHEVTGEVEASVPKTLARKLFTDVVHVENGNCSNDIDCEEEAKTPPLHSPDNHNEVAGLSYVDSQEPGESTQASALGFIERFVKDNASDMQLDVCCEPPRRTISKPTTGVKTFSNFSKKTTTFRQLVDQPLSFDWDEELEDEGGGDFFCRMKEKILNVSGQKRRSFSQPQKSRRCGKLRLDKSKTDRMKPHGKSTAILSDSKLPSKNKKGSVLDTREADITRVLQMELNGKLSARCAELTEAADCRSGIQDKFSAGPDTQLAAEAIEELFCGEPLSGNRVDNIQGNLASVSTVAASKSTLTSKAPQLGKKSSSDGLEIRKSARISNEKKYMHNNRSTGIINVENELIGTNSVENIKPSNEEVCPSMVAHRVTRSVVFNQGSVMLNQADEAASKDINIGTDFLVGVVVPKGKRSRKCARDRSAFDNKSDRTHSGNEVRRGECVVHEVSRSDVRTSGANAYSRRQHTSRHLNAQLVNDKMKTTEDGSKGILGLTCVEDSAANKPVASSAKADYSHVGNSCKRQLPVNLSSSSLRKEISALLSNSVKSLSELKRKRREINELRILFSNHLDTDVVKHQKKILVRLGASLAFSISDATHFIADSFVRTRNMLEAIASGKPIVTHLWLESCYQTSCLIDEKAYILRDTKKERELGFSMPDTLVHASQRPLLQNRKVIITPNSKPSKEIVATLVKAVHGQVIENFDQSLLKVDKYRDNVLVLSCVEDYLFCQPFLNKGVKVYSSELLLSGIITQRLDYARHCLFEDHDRRAVSRRFKRG